jgi:hypothetical protein
MDEAAHALEVLSYAGYARKIVTKQKLLGKSAKIRKILQQVFRGKA